MYSFYLAIRSQPVTVKPRGSGHKEIMHWNLVVCPYVPLHTLLIFAIYNQAASFRWNLYVDHSIPFVRSLGNLSKNWDSIILRSSFVTYMVHNCFSIRISIFLWKSFKPNSVALMLLVRRFEFIWFSRSFTSIAADGY